MRGAQVTELVPQKLGILDYGAGNLGSVQRAVAATGHTAHVVTAATELAGLDKLIFPGVGAAGQAMATLRAKGLDEALRDFASNGRLLLGICVGMQVLGQHSEEDDTPCLGLLPYRLTKFCTEAPVPHMGWNSLEWNTSNPAYPDFATRLGSRPEANVYYVHSYCAALEASAPLAGKMLADLKLADYVLATSEYGGQRFLGAVAAGNIWGTQFHVEKSGTTGLQMLKNFIERRLDA